jgi:hypothetical protein
MSLAKEINERLDAMLALGDDERSRGAKETLIKELNKITGNGQNVRDVFNNIYYINDFLQDKQIVQKQNESNKVSEKPSYDKLNGIPTEGKNYE